MFNNQSFGQGGLFQSNVAVPAQQARWMSKPPGDPNPLSYLKPLDFLMVKEVVSMTEVVLGFSSQSKYGVFNKQGEQVFYAFEESDLCQRLYCPQTRAFVLHIVDSANQEIIRIRREFRCCSGCSFCACIASCRQEVTVESPPGVVIGHVTQGCSCLAPQYMLKDAGGNDILSIVGPKCICDGPFSCCCENEFTLYGTDHSTVVGKIHKKYRGFLQESITSADEFSIEFPMDLDSGMKAVTLGGLFLIDFAHFGLSNKRSRY